MAEFSASALLVGRLIWTSASGRPAYGGEGRRFMYYVYVLESDKDSRHYIGHTNNLERRILEHNTNRNRKKYTSSRGPWQLLFYEAFATRAEAMKRERFLKTGKGRKYIRDRMEKEIGK